MAYDPQQAAPVFRIDVSANPATSDVDKACTGAKLSHDEAMVDLLGQLVGSVDRQNELLEELTQQINQTQKQRAVELGQWRRANPSLSNKCRRAAEALSRVQTQFLESLTEEIVDSEEHLIDGDFMLNEFVDRFGPRLAHLNGVLQVMAQLSSTAEPADSH